MALKQSKWAKGLKQVPESGEARGVVVERFEFSVDDDLSVGDIIELAGLPAYHFPVDAVLDVEALGASTTLDVGLMSGDYGDNDAARTCSNELFAAQSSASAAVVRMTKSAGFQLASSSKSRSIGVKLGGAGVTASGQRITLILQYTQ